MENKKWFEDLNEEKVKKASDIPPQIDLPKVDEPPIMVTLIDEPFEVEVTSRDEEMLVVNAKRESPLPQLAGTLILPVSLRFNIAKTLMQSGKDYKTVQLKGMSLRIWSIQQGENKYYQCEIL